MGADGDAEQVTASRAETSLTSDRLVDAPHAVPGGVLRVPHRLVDDVAAPVGELVATREDKCSHAEVHSVEEGRLQVITGVLTVSQLRVRRQLEEDVLEELIVPWWVWTVLVLRQLVVRVQRLLAVRDRLCLDARNRLYLFSLYLLYQLLLVGKL